MFYKQRKKGIFLMFFVFAHKKMHSKLKFFLYFFAGIKNICKFALVMCMFACAQNSIPILYNAVTEAS